jgi:prepilin-type processing-associated H-X9-DG protein
MNLCPPSPRPTGFTLAELLALVAIVAVLSALVAPALAKTKSRTANPSCLYNKRQLAMAWQMYAMDFAGRVPNNFGVSETLQGCGQGRLETWANNIMTWYVNYGPEARSVTNLAWVRDGVFGKYTGDHTAPYRCPADTFLSPQQVKAGFPYRVRSVTMNSLWGRFSHENDGSEKGRNPFFPQFRQFLKNTDCPSPERTWVFIDEHPDSINDGYFFNDPNSSSWPDIPASYHAGGAGVAFADGHVEQKHWASDRSKFPVKFMYPNPRPLDAAGKGDFAWLRTRTGFVKLDGTRMYGY